MTSPKCTGMLCKERLEEDRRDETPVHICPFDQDVYNKTTECNCCEACAQACLYEI